MRWAKCPSCRKIIAVGGRGKRVGRTAEVGSFFYVLFFIGPESNHWLPCLVSRLVDFCSNCWIGQSCYMGFSKLLHGFVKIDGRNSLSCYMDFSKMTHGFLKFSTWTCQISHHDLFKLLHGFVKVVLCISCPLSNKIMTMISMLVEVFALN